MWARITAVHKVFGIASAIILILSFFGITRYTDLMQRLKSDAASRIRGGKAAAGVGTTAPRSDALWIPQNPVADGTAYTVELRPQDMSSHRWDLGETTTRVFRSPAGKGEWAEVAVKRTSHFQRLELRLRDHNGDIESKDVGPEDVTSGCRIEVRTKAFTLTATVRDIRVRDDPDPAKPFSGKVFERLSLDIAVVET